MYSFDVGVAGVESAEALFEGVERILCFQPKGFVDVALLYSCHSTPPRRVSKPARSVSGDAGAFLRPWRAQCGESRGDRDTVTAVGCDLPEPC